MSLMESTWYKASYKARNGHADGHHGLFIVVPHTVFAVAKKPVYVSIWDLLQQMSVI